MAFIAQGHREEAAQHLAVVSGSKGIEEIPAAGTQVVG